MDETPVVVIENINPDPLGFILENLNAMEKRLDRVESVQPNVSQDPTSMNECSPGIHQIKLVVNKDMDVPSDDATLPLHNTEQHRAKKANSRKRVRREHCRLLTKK